MNRNDDATNISLDKSRDSLFEKILFTVWFILAFYVVLFYLLDASVAFFAVGLGAFFLSPLTFALNRKGFHYSAKVLLLISSNFYIYTTGLSVSHAMHSETYYIPAMMVPLLVFSPRHKITIASLLALPVFMFAVAAIFGHDFLPEHLLNHQVPLEAMKKINFTGSFLISLIFIQIFTRTILNLKDRIVVQQESERKRLELANNQLKEAQRIGNIGNWSWDGTPDGIVWSDQMFEIFPFNKEEGAPSFEELRESIFSEDVPEWERRVEQSIQDGVAFTLKFRIEKKEDSTHPKWIEANHQVLKDDQGKVYGLFGTCQDITPAMEQIKSQEFAKTLIDQLPLALFSKDYSGEKGKFTLWNAEAETLWGLSQEQVIGKTDFDFFPEEEAKHFQDKDRKTLRENKRVFVPKETVSSPKGEIYFKTWKVPVKDEKGQNVTLLGISQDITEEEKIKKRFNLQKEIVLSATRSREAFFQQKNNPQKLYDLILSEFLKITDSEYGFIGEILREKDDTPYLKTFAISDISWNAETKKFYEDNKKEGLEFRSLNTLFGAAIKSSSVLILNDVNNDPRAKGIPNGHLPLNTFVAIPLIQEEKMVAMVALANRPEYSNEFVRSLTPLLDALNDILALSFYERRANESQQQAIHASKLASIGQLAAGVSHEINNPLAIISGLIAKAKKETTNQSAIEDILAKQEKAVSRITGVVNGLRTFSRINDNESQLIDLHETIQDTLDLLRVIYEKTGIEIKFKADANESTVRGNFGKFQQVITNLLSNSRDAIEDTERKEILIRTSNKEEMIVIEVSDSGRGIPLEIQEKIFDPFFTTKEHGKGTGMGMGITHSLIKEMDGKIQLESSSSEGTKFLISIPFSQETIKKKDSSTQAKQTSHRFSGRVLVVEDEPLLLEILADQLKDLGFSVETAADGESGLKKILNTDFSFVFTDIQMPKRNGLQMIADAVRAEKFPHFIVLSGGVVEEIDSRLTEIESKYVSSHLLKPYNTQRLVEAILECSKPEKKAAA